MKKALLKFFLYKIPFQFYRVYRKLRMLSVQSRLGHVGKGASMGIPDVAVGLENVFLYDNSFIYEHAKVIIHKGRFIMKQNSGASQGLTIITGEHKSSVGVLWFEGGRELFDDRDVVVEEDVLIGANVTITEGVTIGRGSNIGANAVVRKSIPPYAVVIGNPAKVVGFRFSPQEMIKHESMRYEEQQRLDPRKYEKNYRKYYYNRLEKLSDYLS